MSYKTHGFRNGQRLFAAQLNEMDAQIAKNEQTAKDICVQIDSQAQALKGKADAQAVEKALEEAMQNAEGVVSYQKAQALEDAQQQTARENIGAASAKDISRLMDEMDALHPLEITGFSVSPALAEKGSRVTAQTFAYGVNRTGAVVTLEGEAVSGGSAARTDALTQDRTYTLAAELNGVTKTATASIRFVAPVYYGVGSSYALESAVVLALTRVLTTGRSRTFTVSAGAGEYILYALPEAMGVPTFKVGGFEGGFVLAGTFEMTNASGHTQSYRLYRSVNAALGATTVAVS